AAGGWGDAGATVRGPGEGEPRQRAGARFYAVDVLEVADGILRHRAAMAVHLDQDRLRGDPEERAQLAAHARDEGVVVQVDEVGPARPADGRPAELVAVEGGA